MQLDGLGDLLAGLLDRVQRVHRPLEDDADLLPADLAHAVLGALGEVAAVEEDVAAHDAAVLRQQLEQAERGGGLAAAGLAGEAEALAGLEREADVLHGLDVADAELEVGGEAAHVEQAVVLDALDGLLLGGGLRLGS